MNHKVIHYMIHKVVPNLCKIDREESIGREFLMTGLLTRDSDAIGRPPWLAPDGARGHDLSPAKRPAAWARTGAGPDHSSPFLATRGGPQKAGNP